MSSLFAWKLADLFCDKLSLRWRRWVPFEDPAKTGFAASSPGRETRQGLVRQSSARARRLHINNVPGRMNTAL
jgi:hypothetical protein